MCKAINAKRGSEVCHPAAYLIKPLNHLFKIRLSYIIELILRSQPLRFSCWLLSFLTILFTNNNRICLIRPNNGKPLVLLMAANVLLPMMPSTFTPTSFCNCRAAVPTPLAHAQSTMMLATFWSVTLSNLSASQYMVLKISSHSLVVIAFKVSIVAGLPFLAQYPRHVFIVTPLFVAPPLSFFRLQKPPSHDKMKGIICL